VGDSITFGAGLEYREINNYPAQLQRMLGEGYAVKNFGVNGATLLKQGDKPYWDLKAYQDTLAFNPDIVVIKLGTNDTKPHNWQHADAFVADYIAMVQAFRDLPSKPTVYLCTPAPVIGELGGMNDKTICEDIIPLIQQIAKDTNAPIIDIYTPLKDKPNLIPDKVHPNAQGATVMARAVKMSITSKND
jgi:lysophospholipase L1-like esterase